MSMRRIAELAGVSKSTVSLVLADSPVIPAATRRRVLKFARQLGYRRNAKISELMSQLRLSRDSNREACFGVISFYKELRPWEASEHLKRIYEAMQTRAGVLGYRLEPLWLHAPGMNRRRFREILDARGIEGLLCFGSPHFDEEFPPEFNHHAVVTVGLSIKTPLHRVINHAYSDTWRVLQNVYARGYRRPGLVLSHYEDERSGHACSSAYLGWCECMLGNPVGIPVLRLSQIESETLMRWFNQYSPDVVVLVHFHGAVQELTAMLRKSGVRIPGDVGVAAISQLLDGSKLSGMQENQRLMGAWAVELLVARIINRDLGIPVHPRIEMVQSEWMEGASLR
jgi:LacI family transcriptional regulator